MKKMKNNEHARKLNGGTRVYICPWNDYRSTNFGRTWGHAIWHGYKKGLFNLPIWMIKTGLGF